MSEGAPVQPLVIGPSRRSARAHAAVLSATTDLLAEAGYGALTIEGVAARAGVAKTTVYRWWPTKAALVIEAVGLGLPMAAQPDTGDLRHDLLAAVRRVVHVFARTSVGAVIPALAADVMSDPQLAEQFRTQLIRPRRSAVVEVLLRAAARGELPPNVDTDLLLDVFAGAVFYRVLISGEPVTDVLAEQLVELLLDGKTPLKPRSTIHKSARPDEPGRNSSTQTEGPLPLSGSEAARASRIRVSPKSNSAPKS